MPACINKQTPFSKTKHILNKKKKGKNLGQSETHPIASRPKSWKLSRTRFQDLLKRGNPHCSTNERQWLWKVTNTDITARRERRTRTWDDTESENDQCGTRSQQGIIITNDTGKRTRCHLVLKKTNERRQTHLVFHFSLVGKGKRKKKRESFSFLFAVAVAVGVGVLWLQFGNMKHCYGFRETLV